MDTNKIVSIKGNHSEWFEHAIFILKNSHTVNKDIVLEAERIINNYMSKNAPKSGGQTQKMEVKTVAHTGNKHYETEGNAAFAPIEYKRIKKRRVNYVSVIMNISLVICCVLLGALLHKLLS